MPAYQAQLPGPEAGSHGLLPKDSSNLDLLRSVAVLAVLISHLLYTFGIHQVFSINVKPLGTVGVLIFFVHTSLVLMMSMQRLGAAGWKLFAAFYVRRIFRIYPLSICCVIAVVLLRIPRMPWDAGFEPVSLAALIKNVLLIQNLTWTAPVIGSLWSLPFELEMYVVLPLLFLLTRRTGSPLAMAGLWALFTALAVVLGGLGWTRLDFFQYVPCFLGGVVAYQVSRRTLARHSFWLWPVIILLVLAVYIGCNSQSRGWGESLLLGIAAPHFRETRFLWLRKLSHAIAKYSYGIYLLHAPLMWVAFVKLSSRPTLVQWIVFAVLMVVLCFAAYHVVEAPLLKTGGSLAKRFQPVRRGALSKSPVSMEVAAVSVRVAPEPSQSFGS